jgi:DNA-binding response OmpR family regulator
MPVRTILLMDDSPLSLDVTRRGLELQGFRVLTARDLGDLERHEHEKPDLVLMDVEMPEAFGDDVAAWLRESKELAAPIYLLSNLPDETLAARVKEAGLDGYLRKSGGIDAVVARVLQILGDAGGGEGELSSLSLAEVRGQFLPAMVASARRRLPSITRLAEAGVSVNGAQLARELHALSGEASLLACLPIVTAANQARRSALACLAAGDESERSCLQALDWLVRVIDDAAAQISTPAAGTTAGGKTSPPSKRLLLLDDSDFYRMTVMVLLEEGGLEVVEARSLSEARQKIHDGRYDLALLDVQLEDGLGPSLIPELREAAPGVKVVVLTGDVSTQPPPGSDRVLSKGLPAPILVREIESLLGA